MTDEDNPYRSPSASLQAVETPAPSDVLVDRGRVAFLGIVAFLLIPEFVLPMLGAPPEPVRAVLSVGLLFAAWRGHGWAITVLAICLGLGVLFAMVFLPTMIATRSLLAVAVLASFGGGYLAIILGLFYSRSLDSFFKYQKQQRQLETLAPATTDNRRNVVALTREAAEWARQIIKEREFPPDSALRVVLRKGGNRQIDVEYDLPLGDERDWTGESEGVVVLVEKAIASELEGLTIDVQNGQYVFLGR